MIWVGKDLKDHPDPPSCHGQGYLPLDQATESFISPKALPGLGRNSTSSVIYLKMTKTWKIPSHKTSPGKDQGSHSRMFWLEKWAAAAAQEKKSTWTGKPRKSLPVLPLPSCLSAVYGLSEPKARALEINPSSKNLSNLFWNHLYSDLSTLLWQGLPQSSYAFVKKSS